MNFCLTSNTSEALIASNEVIQALNSIYSNQKQEEYNFKIFETPTKIYDGSVQDGPSASTKETIQFKFEAITIKDKIPLVPDYFDSFESRVDDDKTIGTNNPICFLEHE